MTQPQIVRPPEASATSDYDNFILQTTRKRLKAVQDSWGSRSYGIAKNDIDTFIEGLKRALDNDLVFPKYWFNKTEKTKSFVANLYHDFSIETDLTTHERGQPVHLKQRSQPPETASTYAVTKDSIKLESGPFGAQQALDMIRIAAMDKSFLGKGNSIEVGGTKEQRAYFTLAVKQYNKGLPRSQRITIANGSEGSRLAFSRKSQFSSVVKQDRARDKTRPEADAADESQLSEEKTFWRAFSPENRAKAVQGLKTVFSLVNKNRERVTSAAANAYSFISDIPNKFSRSESAPDPADSGTAPT